MKIHPITHRARRDGRPVKTYKIRYEEIVRDPATGRPTGAKRSHFETFPTHDAADTRRREIEAERAGTGQVTSRDARLEPFATFAALWVGDARDAVALGDLKARSVADREGTLRRYILPVFAARPVGSITRIAFVMNGGHEGDGNPVELHGTTSELVRRQPDGTWKYVIDHPFGGA